LTVSGIFGHLALVVALAGSVAPPAVAQETRDYVSVVTTRTVYPLVADVVEHFGATTPFKYPYIETTELDAGLTLFCSGAGTEAPDIAVATRALLPKDTERCAQAGADNVVDSLVGYSAIVFADAGAGIPSLTPEQIFLAVAEKVPDRENGGAVSFDTVGAALVDNPYVSWNEVDPSLPDVPIRFAAPAQGTVSHDILLATVLTPGCEAVEALRPFAESDPRAFAAYCAAIRSDEAWLERNVDAAAMADLLADEEGMIGIMQMSDFLKLQPENGDRPQEEGALAAIDLGGFAPTVEAVSDGSYSAALPIHLSLKLGNLPIIAGLREFFSEFVSVGATGADGYLTEQGLVSLSQETRAQMNAVLGEFVSPEGDGGARDNRGNTVSAGARLREAELALWRSIEHSNSMPAYENYLTAFPGGIFATRARQKIAALKSRDSDEDGVVDPTDKCTQTPAGEPVGPDGCVLDEDGDGISDAKDVCPGTDGQAQVDEKGCPKDDDGDGVANALDMCGKTPEGAPVDAEGCPSDSDNDRVPDYLDRCGGSLAGARVDASGCWSLPPLLFLADQEGVGPSYTYLLKEIAEVMMTNPTARAAVLGFGSGAGDPGEDLARSENRAQTVADRLMELGVDADHLEVRGLGSNETGDDTTEPASAKLGRVEVLFYDPSRGDPPPALLTEAIAGDGPEVLPTPDAEGDAGP